MPRPMRRRKIQQSPEEYERLYKAQLKTLAEMGLTPEDVPAEMAKLMAELDKRTKPKAG